MSNVWTDIPTLSGEHVTLEPLSLRHVEGLQHAAADGELWTLWFTSVPTPEATTAFVQSALNAHAAGTALPFAVLDKHGNVLGTTRFYELSVEHRRVRIGHTWYAQRAQRTPVNTETKLLLLRYAFEHMHVQCVQLLANRLNTVSRRAIERLGAQLDGILRRHMLDKNGDSRDSAVYSITDYDWPAIRKNLQARLNEKHHEH